MFTQSYPAQANQTATFAWDGLDAYGRTVQGQQIATIDIGNTYDGAYQNTANFGYNGNSTPITADRTRKDITLHQIQKMPIGVFDFRQLSLGGWSLSPHHVYDPIARALYQGDGEVRKIESINAVIDTVAGTGQQSFNGDGGPATAAAFNFPFSATAAPNGELYIADSGNKRIRKVDLNGIVTTVVGNGADCVPTQPCGDGGPALNAQLTFAVDTAFSRDGSLYIYDDRAFRIRKVAPTGIITTVAGTGQTCDDPTSGCGDGGPATQAQLSFDANCCKGNLTVGSDSVLYLSDAGDHRVRRVGTDGVISTIAGNGHTFVTGGCTVVGAAPVVATNA